MGTYVIWHRMIRNIMGANLPSVFAQIYDPPPPEEHWMKM